MMKLSEELTMWRADHPDEWMMDEFINAAEQLEAEVERLRGIMPPDEHGTNRYGLDMSYFRNLINRDLNRPLDNHQPSDFARMLARMSRTADENVMYEPEFQRLRCGGEAVATVRQKHMTVVEFTDVTEFGTDIPDGTKLYTHPAPAVPDGYTLVPNEPTEAMFEALCNTPWVIEGSIEGNCFVTKEFPNQRYVLDGWKAMLKAAQKENDQ
jgi:hypothetical protein